MGGILGKLAPLAGLAAIPLTGGLSAGAIGMASGGSLLPASAFGGASLLGSLGTVGKVLGAVNSAQSLFSGQQKQGSGRQKPVAPAEAVPFKPQRPNEMQRPDSLSEFGTFTPEQQRSALATKGLNTGLGSDEDSYYRNLVQRSLIGDNNQVDTQNPNFLLPVESQYFSQGGYDTSNILKFLQGINS